MGSALHDHWSCVSGLGWSLAFGGPVIGRASDGACPNRVLRGSQNRRHPAGSACAGPPRYLRVRQAARGVPDFCALRQRPSKAGADLKPGGPRDLR